MRLLLLLLLLFSWQFSFAQPRATAEQCNAWADKIDKYNDKRRQGGSLKQMERYRDKVDEYRELRRKGRCRARQNG